MKIQFRRQTMTSYESETSTTLIPLGRRQDGFYMQCRAEFVYATSDEPTQINPPKTPKTIQKPRTAFTPTTPKPPTH